MKCKMIMLLLILTAFFSRAQQTIKPGDKIIRYDWIKPSHDFYKNVITDTSGKIDLEFMMENVCRFDIVNKQMIFGRSRQVPVGSFATDTSVTDMFFKPIRMHEIHYQRNVSFDMIFHTNNAIVKTTRKGILTEKNYPMQPGYFEDNMIEYIFGYLELKKGIKYTLDNFNTASSGSDPYILEYVFDDSWKPAEEGEINCRVIHFVHGEATGYIWIDKKAHQVLKEIGTFKTGAFLLTKQYPPPQIT